MSYTPWTAPDPQAIVGLNSVNVYGENFQAATGLNHQLAVGSNLQVCVNPQLLIDELGCPGSDVFNVLSGSGLGGNMQFTIGTSTNVVWGRKFDIAISDDTLKLEGNPKDLPSKVICGTIGGLCLVHSIAYGEIPDDAEDWRAKEVVIFQVTIDLLLGAFMLLQMRSSALKHSMDQLATSLVAVSPWGPEAKFEDYGAVLEVAALLAAMIALPVVASENEGHFDGEKQDKKTC